MKPWMAIMAALGPVARDYLGYQVVKGQASWFNLNNTKIVGLTAKERKQPRDSIEVLKTSYIGFSMSPLMQMRARFLKTIGSRPAQF